MRSKRVWSFFVPNQSNDYRARFLHLPVLSAFIFFFLLVQTSISLFALSRPAVLGYSSQITPEKVVELTNLEREKYGLSSLLLSASLNEAARRKAADMFAFDYWAHKSPSGREPWDFFQEVGYDYIYAGENLARDFSTPEAVVAAWMMSPSHRDNIVNSHYQEIGIAVVNGTLRGVETTLVVQLFGTPVNSLSKIKEETPPASSFSKNETLSTTQSPSSKSLSPLLITKHVAIFILGVLLGVLLVDKISAERKKVARLCGDNLAHISFLAAVLVTILLARSGMII